MSTPEKRRVSIIGTRGYPSYYGGFETAVRKLAPFLSQRGWDVTVYGRPGATRDNDPELDPSVTRRVTRGFETRSFSTLTYGFTACWSAFVEKPDVALIMNIANGYWIPLLRMRGIPTLVNVDGIEWERAKWGRLAKFIFHTGAKFTARFGSRMVYDSHEIARRWKVEFGLDGDFIPYGGDVPDELPVVDGLTHRGYILAVARFVPENTIPEFLEAAVSLSEKWPIVIVGSTGYGGELDEQAAQLDRDHANVHWLGHVSDDQKLLSLWQHAGVYFHGHSVGGTNPALVQAMAAGAPIVARDTPYNREVLGEGAVVVQPSPDAIGRALDDAMSDVGALDANVARNRARAIEQYSWLGVCSSYEAALTQCIASTKKAKGTKGNGRRQ